MSIVWRMTIKMRDFDLLDEQLEARMNGVIVGDPLKGKCETFDSTTGRGVFRKFGRIAFDKTDRRWEVRPCADATPAELANLIHVGRRMVHLHGTRPGHGLRDRVWTHSIGKVDGHRYAYTFVARQVEKEELLESALTEALDDMLHIAAPGVAPHEPLRIEADA